ncbi:hypothetical protein [Flavobacterium sp. 3HN19-14]|uniref:hypothetical protein n=1 Tax=Flavobacterium sp. 3HN19-14 TaxID=3448133 RepID=UPI003EDEE7FB
MQLNVNTDHAHNIILSGILSLLDADHFQLPYGLIMKFDQNLNLLWELSYAQNQKCFFRNVAFDSHNDIYFQGVYISQFTFANTTLENDSTQTLHNGSFLAKIEANGTQAWIMDLTVPGYAIGGSSNLVVDSSDHIYLGTGFGNGQSFAFQNETVTLDAGEFNGAACYLK